MSNSSLEPKASFQKYYRSPENILTQAIDLIIILIKNYCAMNSGKRQSPTTLWIEKSLLNKHRVILKIFANLIKIKLWIKKLIDLDDVLMSKMKWFDLVIISLVVDSIQYHFGKKLLKWIDFWKKILTSNESPKVTNEFLFMNFKI